MKDPIIVNSLLTDGGLVADVFEEDIKGLEKLHANVTSAFLVHNLQEKAQHVSLEEKAAIKVRLCR